MPSERDSVPVRPKPVYGENLSDQWRGHCAVSSITAAETTAGAVTIARLTGDIPQNVNFAIKVATLVSFLDAHNIAYEPADVAAREVPATERAQRAEASSIQVECWK